MVCLEQRDVHVFVHRDLDAADAAGVYFVLVLLLRLLLLLLAAALGRRLGRSPREERAGARAQRSQAGERRARCPSSVARAARRPVGGGRRRSRRRAADAVADDELAKRRLRRPVQSFRRVTYSSSIDGSTRAASQFATSIDDSS